MAPESIAFCSAFQSEKTGSTPVGSANEMNELDRFLRRLCRLCALQLVDLWTTTPLNFLDHCQRARLQWSRLAGCGVAARGDAHSRLMTHGCRHAWE